MYYEIYIDVLFLENFMVDSLLLFSVKSILKIPGKGFRVLAGAALGALLTCIAIVCNIPVFIKHVFFHCIINIFMICVGLNMTKVMQIFRALLLLYMVSMLFGGVMYFFRPYIRNVSLFYGVLLLTYLITNSFWKVIVRFQMQQKNICVVSVYTRKGRFRLRAFMDTGNKLMDPFSGEPVNVIDFQVSEQILGICKAEDNGNVLTSKVIEQEKIRYIPYRTIAGENIMPLLRIEKIIIHLKEDKIIINPLIGICAEAVSERQDYQMILNSDILGGAKKC